MTRNGKRWPVSVREALRERGDEWSSFFVESAEGIRAPRDREVASRRAEKVLRRLVRTA